MRSQLPGQPQMKMIDILAHTTIVRRLNGEAEYDKTDRRLSVRDIVVNLLTCEAARTSILFRCSYRPFSSPNYCLSNPKYRMITIVRFTRKHGVIVRNVATAFIRHRMQEAAKRLQTRYDAQKIQHDARSDIFVVTDFDGSASAQLEEPAEAAEFRVLVFARDGKLLARWSDVPSAK